VSQTRVLERCASFVRQVLSVASSSLPDNLVQEGNSLIGILDDLITQRFDSYATSLQVNSPSPHNQQDEYRHFLRFVLGDEGCAVLQAVGSTGYGRLSDLKRFSGVDSKLLTNTGVKKLYSYGLIYGEPYFVLTSRGGTAYQLLTGELPLPSKKDGRMFTPVAPEELIQTFVERLKKNPPIPGGEFMVLRTIYLERLYDLPSLKKSPVIKAYFENTKELEDACDRLMERSLIRAVRDGGKAFVLSPTGRAVASVMFGKDVRRKADKDADSGRSNWIDRVVSAFETAGYRVYRRGDNEQPVIWGLNGQQLDFDLIIVRDRKKQGVLFAPFDDKVSREKFKNKVQEICEAGCDLFVIGPTKNAVERAKTEAFDWVGRATRNRVFTMTFGTMYDVINNDLETIEVAPNSA